MTVRRIAQRSVTLVVVATVLALGACSSNDDTTDRGGYDSARAVLDAHVEAGRTYDLETDCNLRTPDRRAEMASFDGLEAETYCATVTEPIVEAADEETLDRSRAIYTDPVVTDLDRPGGTWFSVVSADPGFVEEVEAVEVDGRWWISTVESDFDVHDDEQAPDEQAPAGDPATGATPTTGG